MKRILFWIWVLLYLYLTFLLLAHARENFNGVMGKFNVDLTTAKNLGFGFFFGFLVLAWVVLFFCGWALIKRIRTKLMR